MDATLEDMKTNKDGNLTIDPSGPLPPLYLVRNQADNLGDYYSMITSSVNDEPSMTRQEFTDEADVNILLNRFGVNAPLQQRQVVNAEIDYSIDLQQAIAASEAGRAARAAAPPEMQQRYPTWAHMMAAIESGEYGKELDKLQARHEREAEWQRQQEFRNKPETAEEPKPEKKKKQTPQPSPEDLD